MSVLHEVMRRGAQLKVFEQRSDSDNYKELVFYNTDLRQWRSIFDEVFGPESKPAGKSPTAADKKMTKDYGGIHSEQTLYKRYDGDQIVIAMLWPWGDGKHTTLKMASFKN